MRRAHDKALRPVKEFLIETFSNSHAFGLPRPEKAHTLTEFGIFPHFCSKQEEILKSSKSLIDLEIAE
jgi:hypothetical protein